MFIKMSLTPTQPRGGPQTVLTCDDLKVRRTAGGRTGMRSSNPFLSLRHSHGADWGRVSRAVTYQPDRLLNADKTGMSSSNRPSSPRHNQRAGKGCPGLEGSSGLGHPSLQPPTAQGLLHSSVHSLTMTRGAAGQGQPDVPRASHALERSLTCDWQHGQRSIFVSYCTVSSFH